MENDSTQNKDLELATPREEPDGTEDDSSTSPSSSSGGDSSVINSEASTTGDNKISKLKKAKKAYENQDSALSMEVHEKKDLAKEKHKKGADYLKSIIYGGLDGIMTGFSIVTAAAGATLGIPVIIILGIANLIADGIAMGVGDFISGKAEIDYALAEKKREEWEYENYPKGEIDEMIEIYKEKGMKIEDAKDLVAALLKHKDNFINTMMVEELGVMNPDPNESPAKHGGVTFISFVIYGFVPLIPFMIGTAVPTQFWTLFGISCALVGVVLFALGAVTSIFTILPWYKGGFYIFAVGFLAAVASYLIGWGVGTIVPSSPTPSCNCTVA